MENLPQKNVTCSSCEKCKSKKPNVFNRNKYLCFECLEGIINHKFRSNLRTTCKIRHEDNVLVCVSGGNSSMCMLNMFYKTFFETKSKRKLFFKVKVLHIDESLFFKDKTQIIHQREQNTKFLKELCSKYHFEIDILNLEDIYLIKTNDYKNTEINMDLINKYLQLFNKIVPNGGFRKQFLNISIQNLIFNHAIKNGFSKIVFGNSGQGMVVDMFTKITTGNGNNIRHFTSYTDDLYLGGKIQIIKPLKDFFKKEILYYNHFNKVDILYPPIYPDKTELILERFFDKLQNTKISTIPSVINTSEKLILLKSEDTEIKKCSICLGIFDKKRSELEFGNIINGIDDILKQKLCYGCMRMFVNFKEVNEIKELMDLFEIFQI